MGLVLFATLVVVVLGVIFFITQNNTAAGYGTPAPDATCNTYEYNGEDAVNLVFFASEALTQEYVEYLFTVEPFAEYRPSFNVYYINKEVTCDTYKGIATLCHSKDLVMDAGACPHDYRIVLQDAGDLRSSAYQGTGSINTNHPMSVFIHEFAHLTVLADEEYEPARAHDSSVNCKQSCEEFTNADGCFEGCSEGDLFRSINNGVMRTLRTDELGSHNEFVIEEWLISISQDTAGLTGNAISAIEDCVEQEYFLITQNGRERVKGCSPQVSAKTSNLAVGKANNQDVFVWGYDPTLRTEGPGSGDEGLINDGQDGTFRDDSISIITVPLESGADALEIRDENGVVENEVSLAPIGSIACII